MDTSVPLLWGWGRGYTGGYGVGRSEGLESIIHSNLFLRTPDPCTSARGVGERVLEGGGQYRAGWCEEFFGSEIHARVHNFWDKKICLVSLAFWGFNFRFFGFSGFRLGSRFTFFAPFAPQLLQLLPNSFKQATTVELQNLLTTLTHNYKAFGLLIFIWPDFHQLTSKAVIFPLQTFIAVTSCAKSWQTSSSSLWRLSNVRETLRITLDPS